jgi:hypothetical protein
MTYFIHPAAQPTAIELAGILTDYQLLCDPEFDNVYEELEHQFAELRMKRRSE